MGRKIETVLIHHPGNPEIPLRINQPDFDRHTMTLWQEPSEEPTQIELISPSGTDWHNLYEVEGWRGVKEAAEEIGYIKPDGQGWEDSLDEILEFEATLNG